MMNFFHCWNYPIRVFVLFVILLLFYMLQATFFLWKKNNETYAKTYWSEKLAENDCEMADFHHFFSKVGV